MFQDRPVPRFALLLGLFLWAPRAGAMYEWLPPATICDSVHDYTPTPYNGVPPPMPKLPDQYTMNIQANILQKAWSSDVVEHYDGPNNQATVFLTFNGTTTQTIFNYQTKEAYDVFPDGTCKTRSGAGGFFGFFKMDRNHRPIKSTVYEMFHMGSKQNFTYVGNTWVRGIRVNHWTSCQEWTQYSAKFQLDYYFSHEDYQTAWGMGQIPIRAVVNGSAGNEDEKGHDMFGRHKFEHIYDFTAFDAGPIKDQTVFHIPHDVVCTGRKDFKPLPSLPDNFQMDMEMNFPMMKSSMPFQHSLRYDWDHQMVETFMNIPSPQGKMNEIKQKMIDHQAKGGSDADLNKLLNMDKMVMRAMSMIDDHSTGLRYVTEKADNTCQVKPMPSEKDAKPMDHGKALFDIHAAEKTGDAQFIYQGRSTFRNIPVDVWGTDSDGMIQKVFFLADDKDPTIMGDSDTSQGDGRPNRPVQNGRPNGNPNDGQMPNRPTGRPNGQNRPTGRPFNPNRPTGRPNGQNTPMGRPFSPMPNRPTGKPNGQMQNRPTGRPNGQMQNRPTGRPNGQMQNRPNGQMQNRPNGQMQNRPNGQMQNRPNGQMQNRPNGQMQNRPNGQMQNGRPTGSPNDQLQNARPTDGAAHNMKKRSANPTGQPNANPRARPTNGVPDHILNIMQNVKERSKQEALGRTRPTNTPGSTAQSPGSANGTQNALNGTNTVNNVQDMMELMKRRRERKEELEKNRNSQSKGTAGPKTRVMMMSEMSRFPVLVGIVFRNKTAISTRNMPGFFQEVMQPELISWKEKMAKQYLDDAKSHKSEGSSILDQHAMMQELHKKMVRHSGEMDMNVFHFQPLHTDESMFQVSQCYELEQISHVLLHVDTSYKDVLTNKAAFSIAMRKGIAEAMGVSYIQISNLKPEPHIDADKNIDATYVSFSLLGSPPVKAPKMKQPSISEAKRKLVQAIKNGIAFKVNYATHTKSFLVDKKHYSVDRKIFQMPNAGSNVGDAQPQNSSGDSDSSNYSPATVGGIAFATLLLGFVMAVTVVVILYKRKHPEEAVIPYKISKT